MNINNNFKSPNYADRILTIKYLIIHYTEMPFKDALQKLTSKDAGVSAHYLIKEDGEIFRLVNDDKIAWHAGVSSWYGQESLNSNSIGIELDNLGNCIFAEKQMQSCIELCKFLSKKYDIQPQNIIAHSDVAPSRKIDPGIFFDWQLLADNGLGIRYSRKPRGSKILFNFGEANSKIKVLQQKLAKLGYKIDEGSIFDPQTNYVVRAFQAKYNPELIRLKGLDFYRDPQSIYSWDSGSDIILDELIGKT